MEFKLVCGSPGAGKNHFVSGRFRDGDVIVDFDRIYSAVTMRGVHAERDSVFISAVLKMRGALIDELRHVRSPGTVWVIACRPEGRRRETMARQLRNAETYLILPGLRKCIEHIEADSAAEGRQEYRKRAAEDWHRKYTPSGRDIIIDGEG